MPSYPANEIFTIYLTLKGITVRDKVRSEEIGVELNVNPALKA